jgi:hypothetical protein
MKCEHDKIHDKLSFATLKHLTGLLDTALEQGGVKSAAKRESICGAFIFQASYFLDNQWVEFKERRYRAGLCFQEFSKDAFAPEKAIITDYKTGEMLHEAALGFVEAHFKKDDRVVPDFQQVGEVYEKK